MTLDLDEIKHVAKTIGGCLCLIGAFFVARAALKSPVILGLVGMSVCFGLTTLGAHLLGII
jgi:uncharacterized membrane protein YccC